MQIYLSEFGKQRLAEEDLNGPVELKNDDKEEEEGQEEEDANNVEVLFSRFLKLNKKPWKMATSVLSIATKCLSFLHHFDLIIEH